MAQPGPAAGAIAGDPLVARLPADGIPRAQVRHRVKPEQVIINEPFAFFHRATSSQRIETTSCSSVKVLPMDPVSCVTYVPGWYPRLG